MQAKQRVYRVVFSATPGIEGVPDLVVADKVIIRDGILVFTLDDAVVASINAGRWLLTYRTTSDGGRDSLTY